MDYKERYENALEGIQEILSSGQDSVKMSRLKLRLQGVFPELVESEDEKIRKELIFYLGDMPEDTELRNGVTNRDVLAWLEKQGEQNHTDKVEPKFKVGDWIVDKSGLAQQVLDFRGGIYTCTYNSFITDCESNYHLWTVQDAKDGDVLVFYSEYKGNKMVQAGIIEKYVGRHGGCSNSFKIYVGVNWENNLQLGKYMGCSDIRPATKEQRDLLFQKMKEAGYEWDDEKKELKKIEYEQGV